MSKLETNVWTTAPWLLATFDQLPIVFLAILAYFTHLLLQQLHLSLRAVHAANIAAWSLMPLYLVWHYRLGNLDLPGDALPVILRGVLGAKLFSGALSVALSGLESARLGQFGRPRRKQRQNALAEIRDEYQQELAMIDAAHLRRGERHFARQNAKRRYLKRLRELLES